jgi:hypothetical protein
MDGPLDLAEYVAMPCALWVGLLCSQARMHGQANQEDHDRWACLFRIKPHTSFSSYKHVITRIASRPVSQTPAKGSNARVQALRHGASDATCSVAMCHGLQIWDASC